jgi:hypothetical protein
MIREDKFKKKLPDKSFKEFEAYKKRIRKGTISYMKI